MNYRMLRGLVCVCVVALMGCIASTAVGGAYTYTLEMDFDSGDGVNVYTPVFPDQDQLQVVENIETPFHHIWVALSGRDGVVRIDTDHVEADKYVSLADSAAGNGAVFGEYLSRPNGMQGNPSRTTTDINGDVWVGNRDEAGWVSGTQMGSVVKISADPAGTTSTGVWNGSTFDRLDWANGGGVDSLGGTSTATDTAIDLYVRTTGTNARSVAVDANNDVWVGGLSNKAHQLYDGATGTPEASGNPPYNSFDVNQGGYGALVDGNGVVWSADGPEGTGSTLVRHDPAAGSTTNLNFRRSTYGLGIDNDGDIWVSNWSYNTVQQVSPAGVLMGTYSTGTNYNRGVAITPDDNNVWVAGSNSNSVGRLDNNGNIVGVIGVGAHPTGVAVDSNGKVWVTNYHSNSVMRIDPTIGVAGAVDLTIDLGPGAAPYNYSDMTGTVSTGTTYQFGTWTVTEDFGSGWLSWDNIFWNTEAQGSIPVGTAIEIQARSAASEAGLGSATWWGLFGSGDSLAALNATGGRWIEIEAKLIKNPAGDTPILSDISVTGSAIPEPATIVIWSLLGVCFAGAYRWRRRNGWSKRTTKAIHDVIDRG